MRQAARGLRHWPNSRNSKVVKPVYARQFCVVRSASRLNNARRSELYDIVTALPGPPCSANGAEKKVRIYAHFVSSLLFPHFCWARLLWYFCYFVLCGRCLVKQGYASRGSRTHASTSSGWCWLGCSSSTLLHSIVQSISHVYRCVQWETLSTNGAMRRLLPADATRALRPHLPISRDAIVANK